jgi:hypothetical protein
MAGTSLQGSDLRQAVLSGAMPREAVVPLLLKLSLALQAARRLNQQRPKLRPRNIRIDEAGDPMTLQGTLMPAAPEPGQDDDERRDVFSLGVTGLFVLHGADLPLNLFQDLPGFTAKLDCDPRLRDILGIACAWDPDQRFESLAAFHRALEGVAPRASSYGDFGPLSVADDVPSQQLLLRQDPTRIEPYLALFRMYGDAGEVDKAWCISAALSFFGRAEGDVRELYEHYRLRGPIRPRTTLDGERWVKDLMHPAEDLFLGKLFEGITPAVIKVMAKPDKALGLVKDQLVENPETTTITLARSFGFVARVLGLPLVPRLFLCPDREGGIAYASCLPPASVCGKGVLSGLSPLEVTYVVAKHLSYYRGERYLRTLTQKPRDAAILLGVARRLAGLTQDQDEHVTQWITALDPHLTPAARTQLRALGERATKKRRPIDLAEWFGAAEITGARTGFLLCGDLGVAARIVTADPMTAASGLGAEAIVRELVLFGVSDQYFRLREHLGIQVGATG